MRLRGLTKTFGTTRGIAGVSLDVPTGGVFGFLGPNGAGKSTTIRLILGLYRPTAGTATVLGLDPWRDGAVLRRRMGYLPGELSLFPRLTGQETLDRFSAARGLSDLRYRTELVDRFGAEVDRPVHTLSKGNRQKLGLVLAFMDQPELVVLDEPTSGLDPLVQDEFASLLHETVATGATVFLSSHDLDEVQRVVGELAIIRDGSIVAVDTVQGLRGRSPRRIELWFPGPAPRMAFASLDGVEVLSVADNTMMLSVAGAVAPVLAAAADQDAVDITARSADLDELFRTFYRSQHRSEAPDAH
ncbi:MAG TPA: ABC transporter ATP-binding protein [Nocardioides sp.]|uniref:ABC transporter ATP-binding protein n=1 Tax=Nocardioides sp. TaxID=35761 RepID=UPI002E353458|nr:ABC transporter ATP-binding protein [Nocardioides sp.]HEX3929401.1 ABC transporter ATP-binding protein [Nocardioides sp.]